MIDLGFHTGHLYSAFKIEPEFGLRDGKSHLGIGTCFLVAHERNLFIVTARHVVDPKLAIPKHIGATLVSATVYGWNYSPDSVSMEKVEASFQNPPILHPNEEFDLAILPWLPSRTWDGALIRSFVNSSMLATSEEFDSDIRTGDFIAAPGYAPTSSITTDRPVLLTGVISSDPRVYVTVRRRDSVAQAVLYQSLSRSGLSGAPVFATQRGLQLGDGLSGPAHRPMRLIGINAGGFEDALGSPLQFSYLSRIDGVWDLLNAFSLRNYLGKLPRDVADEIAQATMMHQERLRGSE